MVEELHGIQINGRGVLVEVNLPEIHAYFVRSDDSDKLVFRWVKADSSNKSNRIRLSIPATTLTTVEFPFKGELFIRISCRGFYADVPSDEVLRRKGSVTCLENDFYEKS